MKRCFVCWKDHDDYSEHMVYDPWERKYIVRHVCAACSANGVDGRIRQRCKGWISGVDIIWTPSGSLVTCDVTVGSNVFKVVLDNVIVDYLLYGIPGNHCYKFLDMVFKRWCRVILNPDNTLSSIYLDDIRNGTVCEGWREEFLKMRTEFALYAWIPRIGATVRANGQAYQVVVARPLPNTFCCDCVEVVSIDSVKRATTTFIMPAHIFEREAENVT